MQFSRSNIPDENKWNRKWLQETVLHIDRKIEVALNRRNNGEKSLRSNNKCNTRKMLEINKQIQIYIYIFYLC